jgi:hypothetical protein
LFCIKKISPFCTVCWRGTLLLTVLVSPPNISASGVSLQSDPQISANIPPPPSSGLEWDACVWVVFPFRWTYASLLTSSILPYFWFDYFLISRVFFISKFNDFCLTKNKIVKIFWWKIKRKIIKIKLKMGIFYLIFLDGRSTVCPRWKRSDRHTGFKAFWNSPSERILKTLGNLKRIPKVCRNHSWPLVPIGRNH